MSSAGSLDWLLLVCNKIDVTLYTSLWYGIHTGDHALPVPYFELVTTFSNIFLIMSWHKVFIQYWVYEGMFSENLCRV